MLATTIPKKIKETVHQTFDVNFKVRLAIGTYYIWDISYPKFIIKFKLHFITIQTYLTPEQLPFSAT